MNLKLLFIALLSAFHMAGYTSVVTGIHRSPDTPEVSADYCDSVPELNLKITGLVKQQIGATVARGECWDLAALVLNQNDAKWDGRYVFGREVDPDKECVYPGDLVQFEGVSIKYTRGLTVYSESMGHHTAVIYEVKAKGVFVLAHQNTGTSGRKVGLSDLDLKTIIKGKYQIYRPVGKGED
ncbi:MAG: hypothetical protein NTW16_10365 [Bacteroidetes bacterium]|nr:hypothetical protein [Bacteroidota bacterium]